MNVENVDDNVPMFLDSGYTGTVAENQPIGTQVVVVSYVQYYSAIKCKVSCQWHNGHIIYSIPKDEAYYNYFVSHPLQAIMAQASYSVPIVKAH